MEQESLLWLAVIVTAMAAVVDARRREIPHVFPAVLAVCAVGAAFLDLIGWSALAMGAALGLGLGLALFALGAMGGGDAKLLAAVGACLGPLPLLSALVYVGVIGGALSAVAMMRKSREVAYGPAIASGLFVHALVSQVGP